MSQPSAQVGAQDAELMTGGDARADNSQGHSVIEKGGMDTMDAQDRSIWDVPDTLQVRKR